MRGKTAQRFAHLAGAHTPPRATLLKTELATAIQAIPSLHARLKPCVHLSQPVQGQQGGSSSVASPAL